MLRKILTSLALIALLLSTACSRVFGVGDDIGSASQLQVNSADQQQRGPDNASTDVGDGRHDEW